MERSTFLTNEEIAALTGRKVKAKQIDSLRRMGLAFFVNAAGRPIVTRTAIEGYPHPTLPLATPPWVPHVLQHR